MKFNETTNISRNSLSLLSLKFGAIAIAAGLLFTVFTKNHREYSAGNIINKEQDNDKDNDALEMQKYFFNVRKNPFTNQLDYQSMLAAAIADRAMSIPSKTHAASSLPQFNWVSVGPTGTGGRTRAILIDNQDPTHQTIFAGGVTGGIWKSTDGGSHWGNANTTIAFSQNDTMGNMNIECIAEDKAGNIYIGTGEGVTAGGGPEFSSGELGGGIWKSTDRGTTWNLIPSTKPANNTLTGWAFTNQIAIQPNNNNTLYAATYFGLYISRDAGVSWRAAWSATNKKLAGTAGNNSLDVKMSLDGSVIIADIGGFGYTCNPLGGNDSVFTEIHYTGAGRLPGNASRIEFGISPTDPNRIYASDIQSYEFGAAATGSGIFMTTNGGAYWYNIGPGGSYAFDPYTAGTGGQDQCVYDNVIAVNPTKEGEILVGGCTYWKWDQVNPGDTVGSWVKISHYFPYFGGDPQYVHPDEHAIVYDLNNPLVIYFGCDGGVFKSTDGAKTFLAYNRNYAVTQYYHICYSPQVNYVNVNYGNSTMTQGLGMGGGAQDNGSPYIDGNGFYTNNGTDMTSGDGGGCAVSQLNPNIAYFCIDGGTTLGRTGNLTGLGFPTSAYTRTIGVNRGANIDSIAQLGTGCFVFPVALYENSYDLLNHDSISYKADKNYAIGDTAWPQSSNGPLFYPYKVTSAMTKDSFYTIPDHVVSKLAVGFSSGNGVWITGQGASNANVVWKPIGGTLSKPDAMPNSAAQTHALAWSSDGDALWVGFTDGNVYRLSNLNALDANNYKSGSLWYSEGGGHSTGDTTVHCKHVSLAIVSGRDIMSIGTDPKNPANVMVTAGGYAAGLHSVFYTTTGTSASPNFTDVQGNLPSMPVYSCILDIDSAGTFHPGTAMIGTEHGVYYTNKLNGTSTVWQKSNTGGFPNVLAFDMKQQTLPNYQCNNSGVIYVGTHGRGIWMSNDYYQPTAVPTIKKSTGSIDNLKVYPNPMTTSGNIEFDLNSADNISVTIYNIQGKEVKTMELGNQAPGNHIVPFGTNDLQAGTYFATLTGTNFRKVSKFIVVK